MLHIVQASQPAQAVHYWRHPVKVGMIVIVNCIGEITSVDVDNCVGEIDCTSVDVDVMWFFFRQNAEQKHALCNPLLLDTEKQLLRSASDIPAPYCCPCAVAAIHHGFGGFVDYREPVVKIAIHFQHLLSIRDHVAVLLLFSETMCDSQITNHLLPTYEPCIEC